MSESAVSSRVGVDTGARPTADDDEPEVETAGLELLSDDCARAILSTVAQEPVPARTISERLDVSRTTVYRRLDRLEEAGLLTANVAYDPDGHHRKVFELAVDRLAVTVGPEGVTVETDDDQQTRS